MTIQELMNNGIGILVVRYHTIRDIGAYADSADTNLLHTVLINTKESDLDILDKFKLFIEEYKFTYPNDDIFEGIQWWRYCNAYRRVDIFKILLDCGIDIKNNGNIVRQFLYAGNMEEAKLLIDAGYKAPDTISAYQLAVHLSWVYDRIKFLTDNGTRIVITAEQFDCMKLVTEIATIKEEPKQ